MRIRLPVLPAADVGGAPSARAHLASAPRNPHVHVFHREHAPHVLIVDGSRVYAVGPGPLRALDDAVADPDPLAVPQVLAGFGLLGRPFVDDQPLPPPPLRVLSLAVAQQCNLACTYCYAQGGEFGGPARSMPLDIALAAVERLLHEAAAGDRVTLAFLGGEPLTNRDVLRAATERAAAGAAAKRVHVGFSITTNGTLLTPDDGAFFERHGFAVTVSLDGLGVVHDRQRPFRGQRGSYDRIVENVAPLLAMQRRMQVSARVTVTPENLCLRETLDGFLGLGFHSVGFSPMLSSPGRHGEMAASDLDVMLDQMIDCGREFERRLVAGRRYPFANMVTAMKEIHQGTHRPYPCGAGAGYLGASADGDLWACHRFVDDASGAMGSLGAGIDRGRQARWLAERHVHRQEPCRSCWARYLCGGGCHHEVIHRGRPACDYIRGWLHYCLEAYVRLCEACPDYFASLA